MRGHPGYCRHLLRELLACTNVIAVRMQKTDRCTLEADPLRLADADGLAWEGESGHSFCIKWVNCW